MSISIPCPQCDRKLKLPDRSLLGRKGKCPGCGHIFVMQETVTPAAVTASPEPVVEEKQAVETPTSEAAPPPPLEPEVPAWGKSELVESEPTTPRPPKGGTPTKPEEPDPVESETAESEPVESEPNPSFDFTTIHELGIPTGSITRLKQTQRRRPKRPNPYLGLIIGGILLAIIVVIGVIVWLTSPVAPAKPTKTAAAPQASETAADEALEEVFDPAETEYARLGAPTKGPPITLQFIPFGAQVVINLHPAGMWKDRSWQQLRQCVPPVAALFEQTLSDLFHTQPEHVDELLVCLIPGPRGTPPEIAAVAHLAEDRKRSQLLEGLGQRIDSYDRPVYVSDDRAYLIADERTLAVCPKGQAEEMVNAIAHSHPVEQIDPLLPMTDRDRQLTIIFVPSTVRLHYAWFSENLWPLVKSSLEWLGDETDTVSCSVHLTDELFYSEMLFCNKHGQIKSFERDLRQKLEGLAANLVSLIEQMDPKEQGNRTIIGRVPAMVEVFSMATIFDRGPRHVQLRTPLPNRAAANLALGTYLAWDESTRTDFSSAKPIAIVAQTPASVAERLKMKIDVDFRSTPMFEAFAFISSEINTPIDLDGDALKAGGFTKNLKQTFRMDAAPVRDVILKIFEESKGLESNPEKRLVVVVDQTPPKIVVTTLAAADKKGVKPFELETQ